MRPDGGARARDRRDARASAARRAPDERRGAVRPRVGAAARELEVAEARESTPRRGGRRPRRRALCDFDRAPGAHDEASCAGVAVSLASPRDGGAYVYRRDARVEVRLRVSRAGGASADLVDVLGDRVGAGTVAVSTDLVTWSTFELPRDAGFPVGQLSGAVGDHVVYVQVLDGAARPLSGLLEARFAVVVDPASPTAAALDAAFGAGDAAAAARRWYASRPWQLPARGRALRRLGREAAAAASEAAWRGLSELPGDARPPNPAPFPAARARAPGAPERFASFRSPPNGLSNQRRDIYAMVIVAAALDRTLVLPWLFTFGEDGSSQRFVPFGDIYDVDAFVGGLAALGVRATPDDPGGPNATTFVHCSHHPFVDAAWYAARHGGNGAPRLHFDWPPGSYSQTTMLNLHDEPLKVAQVRAALVFAARVRNRGAALAAAARAGGGGGPLACLHLRVEADWRRHAARSAKATGAANLFWVDAGDAMARSAAAFRDHGVAAVDPGAAGGSHAPRRRAAMSAQRRPPTLWPPPAPSGGAKRTATPRHADGRGAGAPHRAATVSGAAGPRRRALPPRQVRASAAASTRAASRPAAA